MNFKTIHIIAGKSVQDLIEIDSNDEYIYVVPKREILKIKKEKVF